MRDYTRPEIYQDHQTTVTDDDDRITGAVVFKGSYSLFEKIKNTIEINDGQFIFKKASPPNVKLIVVKETGGRADGND